MAAKSDAILERLLSLHPKIIDLSLDRVWRLLEATGNPHQSLAPVIHIAGTNGKGSTLAFLRAGLEAAGHRVQVYSSPHLARFHERIRLTTGLIDEDALSSVLEECEAANGTEPITFFEITTVAAFLAFSREQADFCLLETGLGGRLDATNVIAQPRLTAITPISIDHQQYLGDTIEEIAAEKSGILKRGTPCIVGPQTDAVRQVIENRAEFTRSPLVIESQDWTIHEEHGRVAFQDMGGLIDLPMPALIGAHQITNAGTALACLRALDIGDDACAAAMTGAEWPARMQRLKGGTLSEQFAGAEIWLDGGHNVAAGKAVAEALSRLPQRPTHAICGMLQTKDATGFLTQLAPQIETLVAVSVPDALATLSAEETEEAAKRANISASCARDVASALAAITETHPQPRILICGSLYLAGEVLRREAGAVGQS